MTKISLSPTGAMRFQDSSRQIQRKMWWNNMKMNVIIGIVAITILAVILVWAFA